MITLADIDLQNISPEKLGELLIEAKKAYYTSGKPIMDDHTYDTLEEILLKKSPYHRLFSKVGNPNFNSGFDKKKHLMPMGSQNKVNNLKDLVHYFELKKIDQKTIFSIQPKCDGISLEIIYKNGKCLEAITRGDGFLGDVITQNVVKMKNFVSSFKDTFSGSVRCEIVVTDDDFKKINEISEEKYSNSRNAVSGISQRLDGKYAQYCSLYAVDLNGDKKFLTEKDKIDYLKDNAFVTVENIICNTFDQIEKVYQEFLVDKRKLYQYEMDGLVVKINDLKLQEELGSKNNRPKGQVAYKFPSRSSESKIININWQVGPMGSITPVAQVDPIEISGAIISYASLANYQLIKEKNINVDDIVQIERRGDVIPHIEKVISKVNPGHAHYPQKCPSCSSPLIVDNKFIRCPNIKNCPEQILGSLKLFCDVLDIKGISQKTIKKLYQKKLLRLPGDFYDLKVSNFQNIEGLGEKSGTNFYKEIQNKRKLSLAQLLQASSIPSFSSKRILQIIKAGFDSPEKILDISEAQLEALPGIQITLARKIYQGIQDRKDFIASILNKVSLTRDITNNSFKNLSFVITGTLSVSRKEIEKEIINKGGKVLSTVSQNTNYLISNQQNSLSSKFIKAKKLGVKIIDEKDFKLLANKQ